VIDVSMIRFNDNRWSSKFIYTRSLSAR